MPGAKLYTSLERAKMELAGGQLPVMTQIPKNIQHIIDPEFTIGLGALMEDDTLGLRCPFRGCGEWFQNLSAHISWMHSDVGNTAEFRKLMGIPKTAPLCSLALRIRRSITMSDRIRSGEFVPHGGHGRPKGEGNIGNAGSRNFRNNCQAQIAQRILTLADKLGRSPSKSEAEKLDPNLVSAVSRIYGTWNAAKSALELKAFSHHRAPIIKEHVLEQLRAYFQSHGRLPFITEVGEKSIPLVPGRHTILRAFNADNYPDAMNRASIALGVPYSFNPKKSRPKPNINGRGYKKGITVKGF